MRLFFPKGAESRLNGLDSRFKNSDLATHAAVNINYYRAQLLTVKGPQTRKIIIPQFSHC